MAGENKPWNLESFIDALVVELDKARETLAVKALNRPLSYTVKDLSLDLQLFPTYNGDDVSFTTARPGEQGASKISLQLASITDDQVRTTSKKPATKDDIKIEDIPVDDDTKKTLRKIGVTSVKDIEDMEKRNIDLAKIAPQKVNYGKLANMINQAKRNQMPPKVMSASLANDQGSTIMVIKGANLSVQQGFKPIVFINDNETEVKAHNQQELQISMNKSQLRKGDNEIKVILDPYSNFKVNVKN